VIADTCTRWRVPYFSAHGYDSVTDKLETAERVRQKIDVEGKQVTLLYLGDDDPSGVHMGEQLEKFLALILDDSDDAPMSEERFKRWQHPPIDDLSVSRIALTMDQVRRYRPPPNPVKDGDSRAAAYVDRFGTDECWDVRLAGYRPRETQAGRYRPDLARSFPASNYHPPAPSQKDQGSPVLSQRGAFNNGPGMGARALCSIEKTLA
jgi:hypothetical protein